MKRFLHINASSLEDAVLFLRQYEGKAVAVAGGTDLLGKLKDEILPTYPEAVVNLKTIPGLDGIGEEEGYFRIGALARIEDIAGHPGVQAWYPALAEAARRTASPQIRAMGTIGGNLCQDIRCWYYRSPNNRFACLRKGGGRCYALEGNHRSHSIFGGSVPKGCIAVHPSDLSPALIALGAVVKTSKRTVDAEEFFDVGISRTTILDGDEVVVEIVLPKPHEGAASSFIKFALRRSIDFPIVNCAAMIARQGGIVGDARICLNGVYVKPLRAKGAESELIGKSVSGETAEAAALKAVSNAKPLRYNRHLVEIAQALLKRAILMCR